LRLVSHGDSYNVLDEQGRALSGTVAVEFYIDPNGYPRMMRPVGDADPVLSQAAVMTVSNMRFTPPRHNGRPAVTQARMPVILGE
jgi:TonB family protein